MMNDLENKKKKIIVISILLIFVLILVVVIINRDKIDFSSLMGNSTTSGGNECPDGYVQEGDKCVGCPKNIGVDFEADSENRKCVTSYSPSYYISLSDEEKEKITGAGYNIIEFWGSDMSSADDDIIKYNSCSDGYKLVDGKCQKELIEGVGCSDGYIYNAESDKCEKTITNLAEVECSDGYELVDGKCQKENVIDAKVQYTCLNGYNLVGNKCIKTDNKNASIKYKCSSGYKLSGNKCIKTSSKNASIKYKCSKGYKLKGNKCIKGKKKISATKKYKCSSGYKLSGKKCIKTSSKNATINYTCSNGYKLSGNKCIKTSSINATINYTCSSDYKLSGNKCYKLEYKEPTYYCKSENAVLNGNNCIEKEEVSPCPDGYDSIGNTTCRKIEYIDNSCIEGDKQEGNVCIRKVKKEVKYEDCPEGDIAIGNNTCKREYDYLVFDIGSEPIIPDEMFDLARGSTAE